MELLLFIVFLPGTRHFTQEKISDFLTHGTIYGNSTATYADIIHIIFWYNYYLIDGCLSQFSSFQYPWWQQINCKTVNGTNNHTYLLEILSEEYEDIKE